MVVKEADQKGAIWFGRVGFVTSNVRDNAGAGFGLGGLAFSMRNKPHKMRCIRW